MITAFLITFRESLEAAVIVGILLVTLRALGEARSSKYIWAGVAAGIVASLTFAVLFQKFLGGFSGTAEKTYEGILMIAAAGLITHMVFWMQKHGRTLRKQTETKIKAVFEKKEIWVLALITFFAVVREGVETVIFFSALDVQSDSGISLIGGVLGVIAAVILTTILFYAGRQVSATKFLKATGVVLLFIAGGLIAHGIVEFQGANLMPTFVKPLYDLTPILSESTGIGALLKALFGYDANPSLIAVIAYIAFLVTSLTVLHKRK